MFLLNSRKHLLEYEEFRDVVMRCDVAKHGNQSLVVHDGLLFGRGR